MGDLWYPGAVRDPAPASIWGSRTGGGAKFLIHTTEGGLGAFTPGGGSYYGNPYWPNYTLAIRAGVWTVYQHIPANYGGAALQNAAGGVQTNRACTQIEIATRAVDVAKLPSAALDALARLLVWEHQVRGVPLRSTVRWVSYPSSYGSGASQRLSGTAWDAYAGVLGHQHCPENDHGDPGAFPIHDLLSRATTLLSGDDMPTADEIAQATVGLLTRQYQDAARTLPGGSFAPMGDFGGAIARVQSNTGKALTTLDLTKHDVDVVGQAVADTKGDVDFVGAVVGQIHDQLGDFVSDFAKAMTQLEARDDADQATAREYADYFAAQLVKFTSAAAGLGVELDPPPWGGVDPVPPAPVA